MKVDSVYKETAKKNGRKVIFQFHRNIFSSLFLPLSRFEDGQGHWILILNQSSLSIKGDNKLFVGCTCI